MSDGLFAYRLELGCCSGTDSSIKRNKLTLAHIYIYICIYPHIYTPHTACRPASISTVTLKKECSGERETQTKNEHTGYWATRPSALPPSSFLPRSDTARPESSWWLPLSSAFPICGFSETQLSSISVFLVVAIVFDFFKLVGKLRS